MKKLAGNQVKYDFIVIGAGSAGCVVAGRLGEAGFKVLLLEAGGNTNNPWIHIPLGYPKLFANPKVNWCYRSGAEPNLNGRKLFLPRGKILGGTGAINGMIYMRGQPADFDSWAGAGCDGWSWEEVLPYFKLSEHQERGADEYHNIGGPIAVSDLRTNHDLGEAFHAASSALGAPLNSDFNGASQEGTGFVQTTTKNGRRWTTAQGYLHGRARKNTNIKLYALATKILFDRRRAKGVVWSDRSGEHIAGARYEIILCGGVFNSPHLLKVSGVGAANELIAHGIQVVSDVKDIGENLQDHFGVGLEFRSKNKNTVNELYNNSLRRITEFTRYLILRTGPFADNGNYSSTFIRTNPETLTPDVMITFMAWAAGRRLKPRPFSGFSIFAEHLRPDSRGYVRLSGHDPKDPPSIKFNFLESEADRTTILAGLKHARRISQTAPLNAEVEIEVNPGAGVDGDAALLAYCRSDGHAMHHSVGTCRMGSDSSAVVDPRLRVRGVAGLRVIDASIMPKIVSANTNAATIMIAEKGAAMVLQDTAR